MRLNTLIINLWRFNIKFALNNRNEVHIYLLDILTLLQRQLLRNFTYGTLGVDIVKNEKLRYTLTDLDKRYTIQMLGKDVFWLFKSENIVVQQVFIRLK